MIAYEISNYEIGKPFPHPENPAPGMEVPKAMLTAGFFDMVFYSQEPPLDKAAFLKAHLTYGLYETGQLPFFLFVFKDFFAFDVSLNVSMKRDLQGQQALTEWLESEINTIQLFLVHATTNVLNAKRTIKVKPEVANELREIGKKQLELYPDYKSVDAAIFRMSKLLTTSDVVKRSTMYKV